MSNYVRIVRRWSGINEPQSGTVYRLGRFRAAYWITLSVELITVHIFFLFRASIGRKYYHALYAVRTLKRMMSKATSRKGERVITWFIPAARRVVRDRSLRIGQAVFFIAYETDNWEIVLFQPCFLFIAGNGNGRYLFPFFFNWSLATMIFVVFPCSMLHTDI